MSIIKKKFIFSILATSLCLFGYSSQIITHRQLQWSETSDRKVGNTTFGNFVTFYGALTFPSTYQQLPVFSFNQLMTNKSYEKVTLMNEIFLPINSNQVFQNQDIVKNQEQIEVTGSIAFEKGNPILNIKFVPIRYNASIGSFEKLVSFDIVIDYRENNGQVQYSRKKGYTSNSVLAQGDWFKLAVTNTGIHKIDSVFLKNNKINLGGFDPRTIKIYGNAAGMLSQKNSEDRIDDLKENAIWVAGESDGKFDPADYILFYGRAQNDVWKYDSAYKRYSHETNIYSDTTYYFLTFGGNTGKRISAQLSVPTPNKLTNQYDLNIVHETDRINLIGSGRLWVGEEFDRVAQQEFTYSLDGLNITEPVFIKSATVARSFNPSKFKLSINGSEIITHNIGAVVPNFESAYAARDYADPQKAEILVGSNSIRLSYLYEHQASGSIGWLDYFEIQTRNYLSMPVGQMSFRDSRTTGPGNITQFDISNITTGIRVWELSDLALPMELLINSGSNGVYVVTQTDSLKEFIAFDGREYFTPGCFGKIANQNLHSIGATDYVIVTHSQFMNEAAQLASVYAGKLRTKIVTIEQVNNEFASGSQDICAIRDFMRMLYKRAASATDRPKYLLIFGRASYDYKYRSAGNTNFVPTYESVESFNPVISYCSDDFFGFLDDNEGTWDSDTDYGGSKLDKLDIGIGRLPAQDNIQAQNMVTKILGYKTTAGFGEWRNRLVVISDGGENGDMFFNQSEKLTNTLRNNCKNYNTEKIYSDAFKMVEEAGGARNPDAQAQIVRSVERGALLVDYTGHGGPVGLSAERILNTDDIRGWTNGLKLPLFFTATCEFSRFDDPKRTSAGELALLNPNGGAIALFSTVRLTGLGSNNVLNEIFFNYAGFDSASAYKRLTLGEIMLHTKNDYAGDKNERNFSLLGDPAMMLAYPEYKVITTAINLKPVSITPDTMKAFSKVTVDGNLTDLNGMPLTNFNGIVFPTVFDKPQTYYTLGNVSGSSAQPFGAQNNAIYRGKVSVNNGTFRFSFIVPKDISYQNGFGKISYYAQDNANDANGYYDQFVVGGTADSVGTDNAGPQIELFMNDEKFVNGGLTNESPLFIARLKDDNGINIVGKGIGRDLLLTYTDAQSNKSISLNDYYQAKLDTYKEGDVNYRFKSLSQGNHSVTLKAWDIYNNQSQTSLDFVVATSENLAIQHVLNFPNPFTTNTTFHFDHNKAGETLVISIQIFTISGKLIKTLSTETVTSNGHFDQLSWDGKDDYGDGIGKGVYVYKVNVRSNLGKNVHEFQKLVILN